MTVSPACANAAPTLIGAARLYLYGSVARDADRADGDVDLLIDPKDEDYSLRHDGRARRLH